MRYILHIENIKAPHKRIEELVDEKTTPRNRSEEEIAGYRDALNTVHLGSRPRERTRRPAATSGGVARVLEGHA